MDIPQELVKQIAEGNSVLFVGAGLSLGAGLPGWGELLAPLCERVSCPPDTEPLRIAQNFEIMYGRHALISYIVERTQAAKIVPTRNHLLLARLPVRIWVTTNYDNLLELTLQVTGKPYQKIVRDLSLPFARADVMTLVKLHGDSEQPDSIVITQDDFSAYPRTHPAITRWLTSLLVDKTFLFVGYGIHDPDFNQIYTEIAFDMQGLLRRAYGVFFNVDELTVQNFRAKGMHILNFPLQKGESMAEHLGKFLEELVSLVDKVGHVPKEIPKQPLMSAEIPSQDVLEVVQQKYSIEQGLCFVLMPFERDFNEVYEEVIKPTVTGPQIGMRCVRADEIYSVKPIIDDIWTHIQKAELIIADLTGRNPNVFYELGLSHAVRKKTILIMQNLADVPFDLRHLRLIEYRNTIGGGRHLGEELLKTIQSIR